MKSTLKKIITFALVLAFMIPCLAGLGALDASAGATDIELLQITVSHLKEDVDDLKTAIESKADTETVNAKIAKLETDIANAETAAKNYSDTQDAVLKAELEAAIVSTKTELTEAINKKADAETVNAKIAELEAELDTLNTELDSAKKATAELEAKSTELQTFSVVVCFIAGISLGGCCALAIYVITDRKKRTRYKTT